MILSQRTEMFVTHVESWADHGLQCAGHKRVTSVCQISQRFFVFYLFIFDVFPMAEASESDLIPSDMLIGGLRISKIYPATF